MMTNLFLSILGISISVGVMVVILMMLTPFLNKRYAAKWKYMIWIFLALRLLIPFSGMGGELAAGMLSQMERQSASESEEDTGTQAGETGLPVRIVVEIPARMTAPIADWSGENTAGITLLDFVVSFWMAGSLIFLAVHVISYSHYRRQVLRKGKVIEDRDFFQQMLSLKRELHISRTIRPVEYYKAESPMIIGFIMPILVLPEEQYTEEELFFILKHELVHLKRGDVYFKMLFVAANAVHWFNPLIWTMQKEASVDMEMSCDERVMQGAGYAVRKAYTEILMSVLHKRCAGKNALSTQFYDGKKILKRRFKNILIKKRKKNGAPLLLCTIVITICLGAVAGCFAIREHTENNDTGTKETENAPDRPEAEAVQREEISADDSSSDNDALENTTVLTFMKEGEQEQKQAVLAVGDGYSLYLPEEEEWSLSGPDLWTTPINEQVVLWVTHFEGQTMDSVEQELSEDGYETMEDGHKWKQEGDLLYHVELKVSENDVWGIYYCYPAEAEEGWGRELPVVIDTFALSVEADEGGEP